MDAPRIRFFFDYLDPLSYLVHLELDALRRAPDPAVDGLGRVPLELRPPPAQLMDPDDPFWTDRWRSAQRAAADRNIVLAEPAIVPWTRKAHELVLHAVEKGLGDQAHDAVFEAVFVRGDDIGRVDVLVALARRVGLDAHETKAVLDVDRFTHQVESFRTLAQNAGITDPPAVAAAGRTLQGFHNRDALRTFLLR